MSAQNSSAPQQPQLDADDAQPDADSTEDSSAVEDLSLDLIFEILKNRRRRDVIRYLRDQEDRTALGELAEHVAALENDTTTQALTSSQRKRVYVGLYQCHLPKMDDMDIVDFNQNRGYVELGENVDQLEPYLDPSDDAGADAHRYYLGVSLAGLAGLVTAVVAGLSTMATQLILALLVAAYLGCALYHTAMVATAE